MASPLLGIPESLQQRITSLLSPRDANYLSRSCSTMYNSLLLTTSTAEQVLCTPKSFDGGYHTGNAEVPFIEIPDFDKQAHSVTLKFNWEDQGWGNRKGQFWIVGYPSNAQRNQEERFHGGRLVYESDIAEHHTVAVQASFVPKEGETYQMWYRVGGGGGHVLNFGEISALTLHFGTRHIPAEA